MYVARPAWTAVGCHGGPGALRTAKGQAMSPTLQTDPPHALLDPAPNQQAATELCSPIWGHAQAYSHAVAVIEDAKSAASGLPSVPVWPTAATGGIVLHNQVRKPSLQRRLSDSLQLLISVYGADAPASTSASLALEGLTATSWELVNSDKLHVALVATRAGCSPGVIRSAWGFGHAPMQPAQGNSEAH